ncbi:unnamed protein product [Boreogadus saida]
MSDSNRLNGTVRSLDPGYEWRYEYYDYEDPVSFEGLAAHRYSIVIVFWVGLAVFVIFMFFVLTLLAKTRAPHPESREAVVTRRAHLPDCMEQLNLNVLQHNASFPSEPPLQHTSRPLLPCLVHEEERGRPGSSATTGPCGPGAGAAHMDLRVGLMGGGGAACGGPPDPFSGPAAALGAGVLTRETPENFDIPNVVH